MGDIYKSSPTKTQQDNKNLKEQLLQTQLILAQLLAQQTGGTNK